jgi:nucleoside 2-deoxyribosyltransferase
MKCYLSGPMAGCTDEQTFGWRNYAKGVLADEGIEVLDPTVRDYRDREESPEDVDFIVETDKADIDRSDMLLANCWVPSVGTSMEIIHAWMYGTPIVVVCKHPSPWLVYHATIVVDNLDDGLKAVVELKRILRLE